MTSELYLARGIAAGMIHSDQDPALVRSAEIARAREPPRAAGDSVVWHADAMSESSDPTLRSIDLTRIGKARYKAINRRGGVLPIGNGDEDPDFTPVELLLAALAGCAAIDVDLITGKRAEATRFDLRGQRPQGPRRAGQSHRRAEHLARHRLSRGEAGDRAREMLPRAIARRATGCARSAGRSRSASRSSTSRRSSARSRP